MHRTEEVQDWMECSSCGRATSPSREAVFMLSEEEGLCWTCAVRRGGEYDTEHERWGKAPRLDGLERGGSHQDGGRT